MEYLSVILTDYILKKGIIDKKKLRNIPIWLSMLFRSFCQHNLQYCDCLVAAYVFRMPVFSSYCLFQCVHSAAACI